MTTAIVVTYNSERWITRCLASLGPVPTIVVDNASRDRSVSLVRASFPNVQVIERATNGGLAVGVNEGIRAAGQDDVLILNPDIVVHHGVVERLGAYLDSRPNVGIVVPRLINPDGTTQASVRSFPSPITMLARRSPIGRTGLGQAVLDRHLPRADHAGAIDWALGAAMMVRGEAVRDVGGMDERLFLYGEDVDWCHRMWQRGWEVHVEPAATMEHNYERASSRTLDLRDAATRHHWMSVFKLFALHPGLLVGRSPRR